MRRRAASVGLLIALSATPSQTEPLACEPGLRPFLELVERTVFRRVGQPPPPASTLPVETGGTLVCRGRRVLFARVHTVPGETLAQRVQIERGRADAAGWSELVELADTARIGTLESCRLSSPNQLVLQHEVRVTWHGRTGRTNTFRIALDDLSLPPCSEEVRDLWLSMMFLPITLDPTERVNIH
jgi:hypothetical protein